MVEQSEQLVDEILVMDCQSGSSKALDMLVSRWQKRLWRYACRLTGSSEAAWEVTQESWLGIIRGLKRLKDPAAFRAWAYGITTRKSIDWIRKRAARRQVSVEDVQDPVREGKDDPGVRELLGKLDPRKQAVLSLYYFEELAIGEIASALGIPDGTEKSRLSAARRELKELVQRHSR